MCGLALIHDDMNLHERAALAVNPVGKKLWAIMEKKQSPLCVAADVTRAEELLELADAVGPSICMLKTHIDILEDFTWSTIEQLVALAARHEFVLFEDRKFADIGNTTQMQYEKGTFRIVEWADVVDAHIFPGPGIIDGLREIALPKGRAILLLAEMSSSGNLFGPSTVEKAVQWAQKYRDCIIGFIGRTVKSPDPAMLLATPGVSGERGNDRLGQQYMTPEEAMNNGSDIIIVGRNVVQAASPVATAEELRRRAWTAMR